jgi:drug/metabolite transporter (DMT)-like permease
VNRRQERLGLAFAALCSLNGAFVPAVAKLTTERADPLAVAAVSSLFAAAAALVVLGYRGELGVLVGRREAPRLVVVGALGTALAFVLLYEGAKRASAIETALCLQTEPVYALLGARFVLGHPLTLRRVLASGLALAGIALAIGVHRLEVSSAIAILLLTPLAWQLSHFVVLLGLPGISPQVLTGARYVYGGAILALVLAVQSASDPGRLAADVGSVLPLLAVQGLVLSYVGTAFWYQAIARLDLARTTAIVVPSVPLLSFGASFLLLGEVATPVQWAGLLLTAAGVLAFVTAPHLAPAPIPRRAANQN